MLASDSVIPKEVKINPSFIFWNLEKFSGVLGRRNFKYQRKYKPSVPKGDSG